MSMRDVAKFVFGISRIRFRALNDDQTRIKRVLDKDGSYNAGTGNGRIIGGTGPFDFSGAAAPSAIPLSIKFDNGAVETVNVDLFGHVADISAVTVVELVARINVAAPTDMIASKEAVTLRLLLNFTGTDDPDYIQVYGECAELALIGQGLGQQFIKSNTIKSFAETPTKKDDETISTEPATGGSVDVIIDGYKKGFTAKMVDTAEDFLLMQLLENGEIDSDGIYHDPHSETIKKYFEIEIFNPVYDEGPNKSSEISEYEMSVYQTCSGSVGGSTKEKAFLSKEYDIAGTNYEDSKGVKDGAILRKRLTIAQYTALDFDNV